MFDATQRWQRFTTGRQFAIAQMKQYREDLRKLTELTSTKMHTYADGAALCMALCIALFCAGRLGLHGASPPGWIMGLFLTNNAAAFCFMGLTIWLAMHASFRAKAASVHLLTRKLRVPVPTLDQLDNARRFGSEFEQQDWKDIFRVPYIMHHGTPVDQPSGGLGFGRGRSQSAPPTRRKSHSSWVRNEFQTDTAGTLSAPSQDASLQLPDHFKMYAQVQKEWWPYDVYARVSILYGFLSFIHGLGYYGLGHINVELRAFWVAYGTVFILMVLHGLLLRFDIIRGRGAANDRLPYCEWFGPFAALPAAIGMSLDFRVEYDKTAITLTWVCIFISYVMQLIYTLRLMELLMPDFKKTATAPEDRIGSPWWPDSWRIPSSFKHVIYLVAPPTSLAPGQYDLVRETLEGRSEAANLAAPANAEGELAEANLGWAEHVFQCMRQELQNPHTAVSNERKRQLEQLFTQFQAVKQHCNVDAVNQLVENLMIWCRQTASESNIPALAGSQQWLGNSDTSGSDSEEHSGLSGSEGSYVPHAGYMDERREHRTIDFMNHVEPWRLVSWIVGAMCLAWVVLIAGNIVECVLGEQALVTAPHWSRPPMTRPSLEPHELGSPWGLAGPAGSTPWLPEQMAWHEEKRHPDKATLHRRLSHSRDTVAAAVSAGGDTAALTDAVNRLLAAVPSLEEATDLLQRPLSEAEAQAINAAHQAADNRGVHRERPAFQQHRKEVPVTVQWPGLFEPRLLVCEPMGNAVAALTQRGAMAVAREGAAAAVPAPAEVMRLAGIAELPPLVGASWVAAPGATGREELMLVTRAGNLTVCQQQPFRAGTWMCKTPVIGHRSLPVAGEGSYLLAAGAGWLRGVGGSGGAPRLHTALVSASVPDTVAIYVLEGEGEVAAWLSVGEVPVPYTSSSSARVSLEFLGDDRLLVASEAATMQWRLADGVIIASQKNTPVMPAVGESIQWQAACVSKGNGAPSVAQLRLQKARGSHSWRPQVVIMDSMNITEAQQQHIVGPSGKEALYQ